MPAANIMATQAKSVNSGSSSAVRASLMRPKRLKARITQRTRKTSAAITKSHSKFSSTHGRAVSEKLWNEDLPKLAHRTTATMPSTPIATTGTSGRESAPGGSADVGPCGLSGGRSAVSVVLIAAHYGPSTGHTVTYHAGAGPNGAAAGSPAAALPSPGRQTSRRAVAQRVSSWRLESWSLRSTAETCDSTVFTEM
ncbi:hypothetical protein SDIAM26S_03753 [Streptomyces diastaticus subsp. diastaticus]